MLNKVIIMGRLVRDPELRRTSNATPVCAVTLANDRDYKTGGGDRETDFIDVVMWRGTAEFAANYFHKGQLMLAEGRLQSRKYVDKNGNNRIAWEVQADKVYFAGDKPKDSSNTADEREATPGPQYTEAEDDGDLPF